VGFDPVDLAQRPVFGVEPHRVQPQGLEAGQLLGQGGRLGDRVRVELLGDVALDADRLDVAEILDGRAERQPIEHVQYLPVRGALGRFCAERKRNEENK
jgi:hypothetical protein